MSDQDLFDVEPDEKGDFIKSDYTKPFGGISFDCRGLYDYVQSTGKDTSEMTEEELRQFFRSSK